MIKYMSTGGSKSSQFANDQIIHHIAVSSQPPVGYQNLQNFHLNHGLTTTQLNSSLLTNLSLNMTRSANQLSSQPSKQHAKCGSDEKRRKSLELEVRALYCKLCNFGRS